MRSALVLMHRWAGLFIALFVAIAGLTGALISWDREIDAWLNPGLYQAHSGGLAETGSPQQALALGRSIEAQDSRLLLKYLPLSIAPGRTLGATVSARTDPQTGRPYQLDFNQIAIDPGSAQMQARRLWGEWAWSPQALMPVLYKLHYSLHIPPMWGLPLGNWFMGVVSAVWLLDCFAALVIAFPHRKSWRKSFVFRLRAGMPRLNFDLHRSGGVWLWLCLGIMAMTSISMNLPEVVKPVVGALSPLAPGQYDLRTRRKPPATPALTREQVVSLAVAEATRRGWQLPPGAIHYSAPYDVYGVGFFLPGQDLGGPGLGNAWLYVDGQSGVIVSTRLPGSGSAGDLFMAAQFPLHSGRIAGVAGRIFISFLGVAVAVLSITGLLIWNRRRVARKSTAH
jgi:uncharacterized iron-regulated membrane protein